MDLPQAPKPLSGPLRRRALALIGVELYVRRRRAPAALPTASDRTVPLPRAESAAGAAVARATSTAARLAFVADEAITFDGPAGTLLRHIALAIGVEPSQVLLGTASADLPCIRFGAASVVASDTLLAPSLATLRASAAARRALWPQLRALAKRLAN